MYIFFSKKFFEKINTIQSLAAREEEAGEGEGRSRHFAT